MVVWLFDKYPKWQNLRGNKRKQKQQHPNKDTTTPRNNFSLASRIQSLSEICFKRSGVKRWTLAFKRGTVAACRSGIAEEELFGKWESSISISTSAGNSMARGVAGRWDIDISCCLVVLFSLVNLYVSLVIIYYMSEIICIYIYTYMYVLTAWLVLCKVGLNSS